MFTFVLYLVHCTVRREFCMNQPYHNVNIVFFIITRFWCLPHIMAYYHFLSIYPCFFVFIISLNKIMLAFIPIDAMHCVSMYEYIWWCWCWCWCIFNFECIIRQTQIIWLERSIAIQNEWLIFLVFNTF